MADRFEALRKFPRKHEFFIGFDSDGCVFDAMEIKHKECFCPAFIKHFKLQPVARCAREVWEFVNLYSRTRGVNRFKAVVLAMDLLRQRPEVQDRRFAVPQLPALRSWMKRETQLGTPALTAEVGRLASDELRTVLAWTHEVNLRVAEMCHGVPPFPLARECIEAAAEQADVMVVSQASLEALRREWSEHGLMHHVSFMAGQEMGTKAEHIRYACKGKYPANRVLMCGDAVGDQEAALSNRYLFFPIAPGHEEESWQRFMREGLERFVSGKFDEAYQQRLLREFESILPLTPPWATVPEAVEAEKQPGKKPRRKQLEPATET